MANRRAALRGSRFAIDARNSLGLGSFLATPFDPSFPIRYSLLAIRFFLRISLPLREGHAERRWRLDACDAPRSARHYALTQDARERACDRRADASSNERPEQMPALRSLRTAGSPRPRSICRPSGQPARCAVR